MSAYVNKVNSNGKIYDIADIEARNNIETINANLETKVDKVVGKELSTNDLTDELKTQYDNAVEHSLSDHARVDATKVTESAFNGNIVVDGEEMNVYTHPEGTNPHGTTKADVGLGKVGNFKAVSTEENQGLNQIEKENARKNIGAGTSSFSGLYNDLVGAPEELPASDVYDWAKQPTKPTYVAAEVGLGNVGNFKAVSTEADQPLIEEEKENARKNIEASKEGHTHTVDNITDFPHLGTSSSKDVAETGNASETQVVMGNDTRLTDARVAIDVHPWAKEPIKPSYTKDEVGLDKVGNFKAVSTEENQGLTVTEQDNARKNINASQEGHTHTTDGITDFPHLGTASAKDVAETGNASYSQVVMGNDTRLTDARIASDVYEWAKQPNKPVYEPVEVGAIPITYKGAANGVAELDENGKVYSSQLPSYVDDVIEGWLNDSKFYKEEELTTEINGEAGKIYVDMFTSKTYRWSGSGYVVISETLALGETATTAYRGDRGKIAYDHTLVDHAPANAEKNQNAISTIMVGDKAITAATPSDMMFIEGSDNITVVADPDNKMIVISTVGYTISRDGEDIILTGSDGRTTSVKDFATKLINARSIQTNLGSTNAASFDGTADITPGVTGTLPVTNGGTGATTAAEARANLGLADAITIVYAGEDASYNPTV